MPSYGSVRVGMRCEGVLLSESLDFADLVGVSDLYVPAAGAWVGDYPYLDKVQAHTCTHTIDTTISTPNAAPIPTVGITTSPLRVIIPFAI